MPKEFLVNLADGRYAKVSVALVLEGTRPPRPAATAPRPRPRATAPSPRRRSSAT